MKRRKFITLIGGAAAAWPVSALAQSGRKPALIGYLTGVPLSSTTSARVFLQGLRDLGYVEARDFQITYRSSDGYQDRLPALAAELVQLDPGVIVAGVRYVIRIGIARGQWQAAIYLSDKELPKETTIVGTRRDAEIAASRIIDAWIKKRFRKNLL